MLLAQRTQHSDCTLRSGYPGQRSQGAVMHRLSITLADPEQHRSSEPPVSQPRYPHEVTPTTDPPESLHIAVYPASRSRLTRSRACRICSGATPTSDLVSASMPWMAAAAPATVVMH